VPFSFDGELLEHEFIVAVGITDHPLIGWDAITKFGFLAGGIGGQFFLNAKTLKIDGGPPNDCNMPYMITSKKTIIKANHQMVCQSERIGVKLLPSIACFLSPNPSLPVGLRLHAFVSELDDKGIYSITISNTMDKAIKLRRGQPLGAIFFKSSKDFKSYNSPTSTPSFPIASMTTLDPNIDTLFDSVVPPDLKPSPNHITILSSA